MFMIDDQPHRARAHLRRKLIDCLFVMAPHSQELEPPINPGRFNPARRHDDRVVACVCQPIKPFR